MGGKKTIHKELDIYLSKRRKAKRKILPDRNVLETIAGFIQKFRRPKEEEFIHTSELTQEKEEKPVKEETTIEQFDDDLAEFEDQPKRNFLQDLIKFITPTRKVKEEEILDVTKEAAQEQVESEAKEDMKLLAKTILSMMEHISPDEVKRLKNTAEFATFKELLKKYKVIK